MKKRTAKLNVNRETVKQLERPEAELVEGGILAEKCTGCPSGCGIFE